MDEALRRAGADALRFNAPLGDDRVAALADRLGAGRSFVDIGCGRGALGVEAARRAPEVLGLGVDTDPHALAIARARAAEAGVEGRLRFERADAAAWSGTADAVACIGASHALGGTVAMLARLRAVAPVAVIGDGVWARPPDPENLQRFGPMPEGLDGLRACAEAAGWFVEQAWLSTLEEWDAFEGGWIGGVRAVGTPAALEFADAREAAYAEYRGVLGFGWLMLRAQS